MTHGNFARSDDDVELFLRVVLPPVDSHHDGHPELGGVLDVLDQVAHPLFYQAYILCLIDPGNRGACLDWGPSSMHLESSRSADDDEAVGREAARTALRRGQASQSDHNGAVITKQSQRGDNPGRSVTVSPHVWV